MKKLTVSQLNVGERFTIPSLRESMRNLVVERLSDCSTVVSGQERNGPDEPWSGFNRPISNNVEVEVDNSPVNDVAVVTENGVTKVLRKRKKDMVLTLPDGVFSLKQAATASNASPAMVFTKMQEMIDSGELFFIGAKSMGKGKPTRFFSKDENASLPAVEAKVSTVKPIVIPDGVFTTKNVAEASNVNPVIASVALKKLVESKELFFIGAQSMGKGKPTNFYSKDENAVLPPKPEKNAVEKPASEGKRGRAKAVINLVFPDGEFSRNELAEASSCTPAIAYLRLMELVESGEVIVSGKRKNSAGKGKPTTLYTKVVAE